VVTPVDPTTTAMATPRTAPRRAGPVSSADRPRLARHVRLSYDPSRERHILLLPETVVVLNRTGAAVLGLCDGRHTVAEIVVELGARYQAVVDEEVGRFLTRLVARRCVEVGDVEVGDG
jgi:pyrroloquinoline quinone biosynthesis protein D